MSAAPELARTAGRGVLYITGAKLYFIAAGYAIHFALPRLLEPDPERAKALYGLYGVVMSLVNPLNMVVIQGALQAVSKLVSEQESRAPDARRAALKVQLWLAGGLAAAILAGADLLAAFQRDDALASHYRICAAVVLFYGLYAVFVGVLNGRKEFHRQALFDVSYATLKMALILTAAALGFSLVGVFVGFATAALLIFLAAAIVVGTRGGRPAPEMERRLFAFMVPVMLYTLVLNLLLNVDLWVLKQVLTGALGEALANAHAGDYTAAQTISRIPYQATLAVTFVVFPLISRSTFEGDRQVTQAYIRVTLRYSLIVLACLVSIIGGAAEELVVIPYPDAYRSAAPALQWLLSGMLFFALLAIAGSILTGAGRANLVLGLGAATLAVDLVLCYLLVPRYGAVGAAAATSGAMFFGAGASLFLLWRLLGAGLPAASGARVALAVAVVVAASHAIPSPSKTVTLAKCLGLAALYLLVLVATREIGKDDWRRVRKVFARRSGAREVR
jgi:stage V sporulation protein B